VHPLTRGEISWLIELVHRHLDGMKPYKNESQDLFQFRRERFTDVLEKLNYIHQTFTPNAVRLTVERKS
jgi:uncharacterized protein YutD